MSTNLDNGFENLTRLEIVRNTYLNPTMKIVSKMEPEVEKLKNDVAHTFNSVTLDEANKTIKFKGASVGKDIDLTPIIPVIPPAPTPTISVENGEGMVTHGIELLQFDEGLLLSTTTPPNGPKRAKITSPGPWAKLGTSANYHPVKNFHFTGNINTSTVSGDTVTVNIPEPSSPIKGTVGSTVDQVIESIEVQGNLGSTTITGNKLIINLPDGGTGPIDPTKLNQNFKGFFASLGDIISEVKDPISGKSYAFAKDSKYGGNYYTPYFYVNTSWTELKQDPALLYSSPTDPQTHGVFSIKPDARITVDTNGQLDLSGLAGAPTQDRWFHGYFEKLQDLNAEVTKPIPFKSFAYVKAAAPSQALLSMAYLRKSDGTEAWVNISPMATIALVSGEKPNYSLAPLYGIKNNDMVNIDGDGIVTIKNIEAPELKVEITSPISSNITEGSVTTVQYKNGITNASISGKKLIIEPAQQVIAYDATWESQHNTLDYQGNLFYDTNSKSWMGYTVPDVSGGVDVKWTRIAHRGMSEEVKETTRRLPAKAPEVIPGNLGDNRQWEHTGWSYMPANTTGLPEQLLTVGGYVQTYVRDYTGETGTPKYRMQMCVGDETINDIYVRKFDTAATGSNPSWKPWVKVSMSAKDINDHNTDHTSHRDSFKFYKVGTLDMSWATLKAKNWKIADSDLLLLADSEGVSVNGSDTISVPYTGTFHFSGRIDFDGLNTSNPYPKPNFIVYVYKTVNSVASIVSEHAYRHTDHTKPVPPLQWKSGEIQLNEGDKIHFELRDFSNNLDSITGLRFIPNRNFFVMEDSRTAAGSRIAETFRRTLGSLNAHYNVGVNVHYTSGTSGAVRVYGAAVTSQATNMNKVTG